MSEVFCGWGRNVNRACETGTHQASYAGRIVAPSRSRGQNGRNWPMASAQGGSRLGTRFGPYELHSLIGVGGMGEVYRAYDTVKERTVAVKVLRAEMAADPKYQERFRRESRGAAGLS